MRKSIVLFLILSLVFISYQSVFANIGDRENETSPVISQEDFRLSEIDQGVEIMDQSQWLYDYGYWFDSNDIRWQEFIPTLYNFTTLYIRVSKSGNPGNIIVEIRELDGTVLGHKEILEINVPSGGSWLPVSFQQFQISPGTKYRIYVYSDLDSQSPSDRYFWDGSSDSTYCPKCDTDVSGGLPSFDYAFRTYGVGRYRNTVADFDGDRKTNISVYRPSNGKWYVEGEVPVWWGMPGDIPVPGNYGGCNFSDIAVYRPSNGKWYIKGETPVWWGMPDDVPIQADYDGDGRIDIAVYRPANGKWYVYGEAGVWWGMPDDIPVPGDYDGDFTADFAVYRPSNGKWYVKGEAPVWWGMPGDIPVPGDYDGDGKTDIAVYRPSNGKWYVKGESPVWWGMPGDIPVPGDYDGCGDTDIAVLRPSNGKWYVKDQSTVWHYLPDDYPLPVRDTNADGDPYH